MFIKDRLLGLQRIAVLLHEVAAGKLLLTCIITPQESELTFVNGMVHLPQE